MIMSSASRIETPVPPVRALRPSPADGLVEPAEQPSSPAAGGVAALPRPVLSVAEAAALLGVSPWLVLQEIRRGAFPHRRVGRRIVIPRARLLAWLEEAEERVEPDPCDPWTRRR